MVKAMLAAALLGSLIGATTARADVISTFNASGTFADGALLSGQVLIDTTTGVVTSGFLDASSPDSISATILSSFQGEQSLAPVYAFAFQEPGILPQIILEIQLPSLIGYAGGSLISDSNPNNVYSPSALQKTDLSEVDLSVGSLTLQSPTPVPEPASWAVLSASLVGFGLVLRARARPRSGLS